MLDELDRQSARDHLYVRISHNMRMRVECEECAENRYRLGYSEAAIAESLADAKWHRDEIVRLSALLANLSDMPQA